MSLRSGRPQAGTRVGPVPGSPEASWVERALGGPGGWSLDKVSLVWGHRRAAAETERTFGGNLEHLLVVVRGSEGGRETTPSVWLGLERR